MNRPTDHWEDIYCHYRGRWQQRSGWLWAVRNENHTKYTIPAEDEDIMMNT